MAKSNQISTSTQKPVETEKKDSPELTDGELAKVSGGSGSTGGDDTPMESRHPT